MILRRSTGCVVLATCGLCALLLPAAAYADGGPTIAAAKPAPVSVQEFGNTANGGLGQPGCDSSTGNSYRSWWELPVLAGDQVTLDWGTQITSMAMNILPEGTTDYSLFDVSPVVSENVNDNYVNDATYTVPQDGTLPFEFKSDTGCGSPPGPYNFIVYVQHGVVLSLPQVSTLPTSGTIAISVHNLDGAPINDPSLTVSFAIEGSNQSSYTTIGTAPVSNGVATVTYTVPSSVYGQQATIEATSSGTNYVDATSATQDVGVGSPPPPPPPPPSCVVPRRASGQLLSVVERRIIANHCSIGTVRYRFNGLFGRGRVVGLSPTPGRQYPAGSRVLIIVSRGRRH